jgi:hypothetical protein
MKSGQLFQCGNTIQNGDSRIQPWVDYMHKYNVKTNARLVLQHYLMNKNVGRLLKH